MIILLESSPINSPPISPQHLICYMREMRAKSRWLDPGNELQFKTAISTLHKNRGHGSAEYIPACPYCLDLKLLSPSTFIGCQTHLSEPKFARPTGNPTFSTVNYTHYTSNFVYRQYHF
jgi:hypothetical protein